MTTLSESALVSLRQISKHFGEGETRIDALRDISLDVAPGEVVALRGPSGSGKTTLLNVIACILDPSGGHMSLDGEVVYDNKWLRRRPATPAAGEDRLHLPVPQPAPLSERNRQRGHRSAARRPGASRGAEAGERSPGLSGGGAAQARFSRKAVGGRGATRCDCARARQSSPHHPGRRAHRRPRFQARSGSSWTCCASWPSSRARP